MKPVMQTKFKTETSRGNCFAACLASLLEMPLEDIPKFEEMGSEYYKALFEFLEKHGYTYEGNQCPSKINDSKACVGIDGYVMVGGESPRPNVDGHHVVYRDGKMAHDPHPSNEGVTKITEIWMIERQE